MSLASNVQSLAIRVGTEMKSWKSRISALEDAPASVPSIAARVAALENAPHGRKVSALPDDPEELAALLAGLPDGATIVTDAGALYQHDRASGRLIPAGVGGDSPTAPALLLPGDIVASCAASRAGCLPCNGAAVSRVTYAALFAAVGTTFGEGDGESTFNIPDLAGRFLQGGDVAGTVKEAGLPDITGSVAYHNNITGSWAIVSEIGGAFWVDQPMVKSAVASSSGTEWEGRLRARFAARLSNNIYGKSATVQPPALTMRFHIKY